MPKSKKQKNTHLRSLKRSYNITLDNRIEAAMITIERGKPLPPPTKVQEDFTKDLLDVGDTSNTSAIPSGSNITTPATTATADTVITAPKFIGQKIPVKMRENVRNKGAMRNLAAVDKKANLQSNQQLKDCLTSDIKTAVQDNIKVNVPRPQMNIPRMAPKTQRTPRNIPFTPFNSTPSGVPRSFLTRANQTVIEPQLPVPDPQPQTNYIQTYQRAFSNDPISHIGIEHEPFVPIMQESPQLGNNTQTLASDSFSSRYSPTDLYSDLGDEKKDDEQASEGTTSPEAWQLGEKRVSAFHRLGPLSQPKTPKLTINLNFNKELAVREVVNKASETTRAPPMVFIPVHEREDIVNSTDDTVTKYLGNWPWATPINVRRTARSRGFLVRDHTGAAGEPAAVAYSPTAMMMLKEQMDEIYQRDNTFLAVSVTGYPTTWTKENVLDTILDNLKDKPFIPCFIEFDNDECKFLVIRNRAALLVIHALDFHIQKDDVQLSISVSQITLSVLQLDFIPRLILRKRLAMIHCNGTEMNLSAFTLQPDVSHFIYYPLNHLTNQLELMKLQTDINWRHLTDLNLSHNRLTTIEGFDLENRLPRLRHLDLSYNYIERPTILIYCRRLALRSLRLEGNPLCHDYIDPQHYVTVIRMMFPTIRMLDDVPVGLPGDLPSSKPNYCPPEAQHIVDTFLQVYMPLLDSPSDERIMMTDMYTEDALVTVTFRPAGSCDKNFRYPRSLLHFSRELLEGSKEFVDGKSDIEKLFRRWPNFEHDPTSFTVDVMFHNDTSTVFRVDGIVKLPADSLAENDQLIAFSRTIHLNTTNGVEYKINNEMIYWDQPTQESSRAAFRRALVKRKPPSCKFETPPDEECKKKLIDTFMKLTQLEKRSCERCLELKDWDFKEALNYFMKLYRVDNLEPLTNPLEVFSNNAINN